MIYWSDEFFVHRCLHSSSLLLCVLLFSLLFHVCFTHCCLLWVPSSCIIFCFAADVSYSCSVLLIICLIAALLHLMECLDVLCFIISVSVIMTEMPHVLSCLFLYRSRGPGGVYFCLFPVPYFIFITLQSQIIWQKVNKCVRATTKTCIGPWQLTLYFNIYKSIT
jgi:hypothetical protein